MEYLICLITFIIFVLFYNIFKSRKASKKVKRRYLSEMTKVNEVIVDTDDGIKKGSLYNDQEFDEMAKKITDLKKSGQLKEIKIRKGFE